MTATAARPTLTIIVQFLATLAFGCADETPSQASSPLIEFHRSGGIRGGVDRLVVNGDGEGTLTRDGSASNITVEASVMKRLHSALRSVEFDSLEREYLPERGGADMYQYTITYQGYTVRAQETALPRALQPVVELLDGILNRA